MDQKIIQLLEDIKKLVILGLKNKSLEAKLNAVIALLLAIAGPNGQGDLIKKRKANVDLINYFSKQLDLTNKDLAGIFNTTESGISNLKAKNPRKRK